MNRRMFFRKSIASAAALILSPIAVLASEPKRTIKITDRTFGPSDQAELDRIFSSNDNFIVERCSFKNVMLNLKNCSGSFQYCKFYCHSNILT